jgi:hypothetical protein
MSTFVADYSYTKDGLTSRTRLQGSSMINLGSAKSDFAVQAYLQKNHPGSEILIYNIEWR